MKPTLQRCYRSMPSVKNPQRAMPHVINVSQMVISDYGSAHLFLMSLKTSFWKQECVILVSDQSKPEYKVKELTE